MHDHDTRSPLFKTTIPLQVEEKFASSHVRHDEKQRILRLKRTERTYKKGTVQFRHYIQLCNRLFNMGLGL
jgi:hypothetical protein